MEYVLETIVKQMLDLEEIPDSLKIELFKVNKLCVKAGGRLISRQVIAMIIVEWKRNNLVDRYN